MAGRYRLGLLGKAHALGRIRDMIPATVSWTPPADVTPTDAPSSLIATAGATSIGLAWQNPPQTDLAYIRIKRAAASGGPYTQINTDGDTTGTTYDDVSATGTDPWHYVVTAVDHAGNESAASNEVHATVGVTDEPSSLMALLNFGSLLHEVLPAPSGSLTLADRYQLLGIVKVGAA